MHNTLDSGYWKQEFWSDDNDRFTAKLVEFAKKWGISEDEVKKDFKECFESRPGMSGCSIIRYTNLRWQERYHISILLEEHMHNELAEVEVIVVDSLAKISEYQRELFKGDNCKSIAAGFINAKAKELEERLKP